MRNTTRRRSFAYLLVLATMIAGAPSAVRAQNVSQAWSTVASAGEPDESSTPIIEYSGALATIKSTAPTSTVGVIRYRVAPVDGLFLSGCKVLNVRYRDNGNGATVRVHLRRTNMNTGATVTLVSFDSEANPPAAGYQTRISPCRSFSFDFVNNTYWIEAFIYRYVENDQIGIPGLQAIQITQDIG